MKRDRGLTLVETMVALTILAIGLLGVLAVHASAIASARRSQRLVRAASIADSRLEELGTLDAATIEATAGREDTHLEGALEVRVVHRLLPPPGAPDDLVLLRVEVAVGPPGEDPAHAARQQLLWRGP